MKTIDRKFYWSGMACFFLSVVAPKHLDIALAMASLIAVSIALGIAIERHFN
jgi:hypothetical protein